QPQYQPSSSAPQSTQIRCGLRPHISPSTSRKCLHFARSSRNALSRFATKLSMCLFKVSTLVIISLLPVATRCMGHLLGRCVALVWCMLSPARSFSKLLFLLGLTCHTFCSTKLVPPRCAAWLPDWCQHLTTCRCTRCWAGWYLPTVLGGAPLLPHWHPVHARTFPPSNCIHLWWPCSRAGKIAHPAQSTQCICACPAPCERLLS